jgi:hypothetical protein
MTVRLHIAIAGALLFVMGGTAFADTTKTPPGSPCLKNNGNPCNGNNGNIGAQGNADHDKVKIDKKPPPITIAMPPVSGRGAYISQIGDGNEASVVQTAPNAYARVDQNGDHNDADVAQRGSGTDYLEAAQTGDSNFIRSEQSGAGQNVAYVTQNGNGNWIWNRQVAAGAIYNGARLTQTGNNNDMALDQEGSDNLALLTQTGDDNGMSATQIGAGNRLTWTQEGTGLSDLQVTQTGGNQSGGQLMITQTNGGNPH